MSKPTIKDLQEQLSNEKRLRIQAEDANISLQSKLEGSPKVREQLNMANATVAELMNEVQTLKELAHTRLNELRNKAESLKTLHADYALLEEKYYTLDAENTHIQIKLNAEIHALTQEIERTNRHINLAENAIHREQQPLVVNHYHNCTINKGL